MIFKIIKEKLVRETVTIQVTGRESPRQLEQPKNKRTPLLRSRSRNEKCVDCGTYNLTCLMIKTPDYFHNSMNPNETPKWVWKCNDCNSKDAENFMRRITDFNKYNLFD